jgi:hypothetical protein
MRLPRLLRGCRSGLLLYRLSTLTGCGRRLVVVAVDTMLLYTSGLALVHAYAKNMSLGLVLLVQ